MTERLINRFILYATQVWHHTHFIILHGQNEETKYQSRKFMAQMLQKYTMLIGRGKLKSLNKDHKTTPTCHVAHKVIQY